MREGLLQGWSKNMGPRLREIGLRLILDAESRNLGPYFLAISEQAQGGRLGQRLQHRHGLQRSPDRDLRQGVAGRRAEPGKLEAQAGLTILEFGK